MSVLVVGMSHRSAPVSLLERLSMDDSVRDEATRELLARESLTEAMIVSTCNRMEVYVMTSSFHSGVSDVVEILHGVSGVDMETLRSSLYVRYADAAAEHMMVVTSGLDSMVIGEQQIIGQVRMAYQAAIAAQTVGPALHSLVQASLHTGKRVHTETDIDDAGASMVSFAFDEAMAHLQLESLQGKSALVLGAGAMASLAATHLGRLGVDKLIVANRTRERAERLAQHSRQAGVYAEVVDFDQRASVLSRVDIAVSATGSQSYTITAADVPPARDVMLVDLSLPRDIDDAVTDKGARLVNIERLHAVRSGQGQTTADAQAQAIVAEELKQYCSAQRIKDVAPAVSALRRHAADLVDTELSRLRSRVDNLDEAEFVEVANTVRRVVDKLLHQPTIKAKELAASSGVVSYESALQEFFGLSGPTRSVKVNYEALPSEEELGA